jgi:hypothetical protein
MTYAMTQTHEPTKREREREIIIIKMLSYRNFTLTGKGTFDEEEEIMKVETILAVRIAGKHGHLTR